MPIAMYARLYDSMVAWYMRPYSASNVHFYAVTTLASMGFLNIGSLIVLCARADFAWARKLLAIPHPLSAAALGAVLLAANFLFSKQHRRAQQSRAGVTPPSRWIAVAYIVVSVVIFLYVSTLIPLPQR